MDDATREQLHQINHRFYLEASDDFARTRRNVWPGWRRVIDHASPSLNRTDRVARVIDVGCGDGRFARFLARETSYSVDYLGVDFSDVLLADAYSGNERVTCRYQHRDLRGADWELPASADLVVVIGVLHHLPSEALRHAAATRIADLVGDGGYVALTLWRFLESPRMRNRIVSWREGCPSVDENQLEPGDHLLRFGDLPLPRYAHFVDDAEEARLVASIPLSLVDRFDSDGTGGRLNRYLLFQRRAKPPNSV